MIRGRLSINPQERFHFFTHTFVPVIESTTHSSPTPIHHPLMMFTGQRLRRPMNRSGLSNPNPISGSTPDIISATNFPVIGPRLNPIIACPVATTKFA